MATTSAEDVRRVADPVVRAAGLDLEDVSVTPAGRRRVVRVVVDSDTRLDLDAVADVSRVVSDALDAADVFGTQPYVLEVSSPGVDRPLTQPRHWRRATGRLVAAELTDGTSLTGRVVETDSASVQLDVDGTIHEIPLSEVRSARVQVEFSRPADAGPETADVDADEVDDELDDDELRDDELRDDELEDGDVGELDADAGDLADDGPADHHGTNTTTRGTT